MADIAMTFHWSAAEISAMDLDELFMWRSEIEARLPKKGS
jgi:hypothetical protein